MLYMNDYDIATAINTFPVYTVRGRAARFLSAFKDEVDGHSDGWAHWSPPVRAAKKMQELCQDRSGKTEAAYLADYKKALAPIRSFMTRRGKAAGIVLPPTDWNDGYSL